MIHVKLETKQNNNNKTYLIPGILWLCRPSSLNALSLLPLPSTISGPLITENWNLLTPIFWPLPLTVPSLQCGMTHTTAFLNQSAPFLTFPDPATGSSCKCPSQPRAVIFLLSLFYPAKRIPSTSEVRAVRPGTLFFPHLSSCTDTHPHLSIPSHSWLTKLLPLQHLWDWLTNSLVFQFQDLQQSFPPFSCQQANTNHDFLSASVF